MRTLTALPSALYFARATYRVGADPTPIERVAGPYSQRGRAVSALANMRDGLDRSFGAPLAAQVVTSGVIDWTAVDTEPAEDAA